MYNREASFDAREKGRRVIPANEGANSPYSSPEKPEKKGINFGDDILHEYSTEEIKTSATYLP